MQMLLKIGIVVLQPHAVMHAQSPLQFMRHV